MKKLLILSCFALCSCASVLSGHTQYIKIDTNVPGAKCVLKNDKGEWSVKTPGTVQINKSYYDMNVSCAKGNIQGSTKLVSKTNAAGYANVLFGGPIGAGIDEETGAAFDYPTDVKVYLK